MKKKKFKVNDSKWKKIDAIVISCILIFSLISVIFANHYIVEDMSYLIFIFMVFFIIFTSMPLIMIYLAIRTAIKNNQRKNVVFETVDNIDYYRDNLGEISPATISILMDLDIENDKDICAMLLYYKSKEIIDLDENKNVVIKNTTSLKESDLMFLNWLKNKNPLILQQWKNLVTAEAVKDGYLHGKNNYKFSKGCLLPITMFIILAIIGICLVISIFNGNNINEIKLEYDAVTEMTSLGEQLKLIINNPVMLSFIIKILFLILIIVIGNAMPLFSIIYFVTSVFTTKRVKRTKLGNQLTEKIYAMKNFIHDFGNLSEKTKEHLVLWDYFLIYAIVLEENDKIVNEISNYRNINVKDFIVNKK